jgi:5-amino-6-(5-phosphoribosylamino)uracil reductase
MNRPQTTAILAMTADGKIADFKRNAARFGSKTDKSYLEKQLSLVDGVLFGAGTLRAYGTMLPICDPHLLSWRQQQGKPLQPIHILCSASANLDLNWRFFSQPIPRWLLTTPAGAKTWNAHNHPGFEKILCSHLKAKGDEIDWQEAFSQLQQLGLQKLALLGGGELIASLLAADMIDELKLTLCPVIFGGKEAPTPVEGTGFLAEQAKRLDLLSVETVGGEIFLHYRLLS